MSEQHTYPLHREGNLTASPEFPRMEEEVLAYWKQDGTFQASIDQRPAGDCGSNEFVFYDGPPFANGLPHYGHLLTGYVKDAVGRYQTMQGRRVERRFGWDTHGLPAELEAQRELGIDSKLDIEGPGGIGIAAFNAACRKSVLKYTHEWEEYVTRQARWVDFKNDYKTLDPTYMESVLWAFKQLHEKGLAYEGYRVLAYCWHDGTPLSNHELKMDDEVYQTRTDNTVTVGLRTETGELALIWTTTPWTLPSNSAIAVGPNIDYVVLEVAEGKLAGERVIIAEARQEAYAKVLGENPRVVKRLKGSELAGKAYYPIFDYFIGKENPGEKAWHIITADYVTTEDGTGLVHLAPAFGEDDMWACMAAGIGTVVPIDENGNVTPDVTDYAGLNVFESNRYVVADLRDPSQGALSRRPEAERAVLVEEKQYSHSYPHCWRCGKPLIYRAVSSWFVNVTKIRDRMLELNQEITWVPEHLKDGQFGKWLEGLRDWSISRNRFWGAPIPVWKSDDPRYPRIDVYGSFEELERDFGVEVTDLHRPKIDELVRPNPDDPTGKSMMRRIPDVFDCWFESGSMPFAQVHYPFENQDWFESHYPGDFIVEYIGQTRGWFYTLHVLATALFDRPAFTHCVSHGIVLGDDGRKMSKSLRNYPDVHGVFNTYGSDAMRWFLLSSPVVRGGNLIVKEEAIRDTVRHILLPLWNTYYFFTLYASACNKGGGYLAKMIDETNFAELSDVQDRYLLSHTYTMTTRVRELLDEYDVSAACEEIRSYLDVLTNWYVRTSRDRFWNEEAKAFDTLYTALVTLTKVCAPLLPLVCEEIFRGLTGKRSVHLEDWPVLPEVFYDEALAANMDEVRDVVSVSHSLRKAHSLRVRQPLAELIVVSDFDLAPYRDLIASEVNVKQVRLLTAEECGMTLKRELAVLPRELDPQMRKLTSALFKAAREGEWEEVPGGVRLNVGEGVELHEGQYTITTTVISEEGSVAALLPSGSFVALDTQLNPELEAEGYARDLVRLIQDQRKEEGLHVTDRISMVIRVPREHIADVELHLDFIARETLALQSSVEESDGEIAVEITKL